MAIYTKHGDAGKTDLGNGTRIEKSALRVEAYGTLDEFIAYLGVVRAQARDEKPSDSSHAHTSPTVLETILGDLDAKVLEIQRQLSALAGWVATPGSAFPESALGEAAVERMEADIDGLMTAAGPLKGFVMPGKNALEASLHLARTVCRRSERCLVRLFLEEGHDREPQSSNEATSGDQRVHQALTYVNRLSDWLFAASRLA